MKLNFHKKCFFFLGFLYVMSCKEIYIPPAIQANNNFLVVDGFLNVGADSTIIHLSRTRSLVDTIPNSPELNAQLTVEGQGSDIYPLNEVGNGVYGIDQLSLNPSQLYRLRIITSNGGQYVSDFVPVRPTPPIDSIPWIRQNDGIHIYVNTHDPANNTKYYRWDYTETWEYRTSWDSYLQYANNQVVPRDPNKHVSVCYDSRKATTILIGSSAKLSQDVIYETPLLNIPIGSEKITFTYSLLVKQFALTKEAFEYWQNLRKSTEQVGGLFDAQPSQITGNIHSVSNPNEPVLGFIGASSVVEKRIFIRYLDVIPWPYIYNCVLRNVPPDSIAFYFGFQGYIPISTLLPPGSGYSASTGPCVDCTLRGGTIVKPPFWP